MAAIAATTSTALEGADTCAKVSPPFPWSLTRPASAAAAHAQTKAPTTAGRTDPRTPASIAQANAITQAYLAAHPITKAQITALDAQLRAHPNPAITLVYTGTTALAGTSERHAGTATPDVSVGFGWDIYIYLTPADTENIWNTDFSIGIGAAAAAVCAPGWILAAVCGVVGYTVGYVVTDAVYNYFDWGQCGLEIGLNYDLTVDFIDYWDGTNC
jgi:hypothetical protein